MKIVALCSEVVEKQEADRATLQRNNLEFEDQEVLALTFTVRIAARDAQTMILHRMFFFDIADRTGGVRPKRATHVYV
jgi:hypothetical protein